MALCFEKVPSHQTFSYFKRECLSAELLDDIFNALRDYLVKLGVIDFSSVIIDFAPIIAFVNLAKANREVKLNDSLACILFKDPAYQALAKKLIAQLNYKKSFPEHVKKRLSCLNFVVLYELGGFLSHAKVAKYLNKKEREELLKASSGGGLLPSEVTLSDFNKRLLNTVESTNEFTEFRNYFERFFSQHLSPYETSVDLFFPNLFVVLQTSRSFVDPQCPFRLLHFKEAEFSRISCPIAHRR